MDDADPSGAEPGKKEKPRALWALIKEEPPALLAVLGALIALAALAVEVKRPDIVQGALDSDAPFSSVLIGLASTGICVFAVRRSILWALPGIALNALYWVLRIKTLLG